VLIADDQRLVRAGFRVILAGEPDIVVVGEAADGVQAIELARALAPDVVLMDIRMPTMDGLAAARQVISGTASRVLILTTFDADEYVYEALRMGASGFLLKDAPPDQLIGAVRSVAAGNALIDPVITRRLISRFAHAVRPPSVQPGQLSELTSRELDVLRLVARGQTNAEIADELVVEESTVKTHVSRILLKLGLRDRVQAVVLAYECGFVVPDERLWAAGGAIVLVAPYLLKVRPPEPGWEILSRTGVAVSVTTIVPPWPPAVPGRDSDRAGPPSYTVTDRVALVTSDGSRDARRLPGMQRASRPCRLDSLEVPFIHSVAGMPLVCAYTVFPIQMRVDVVPLLCVTVPVQPRPCTIVRSMEASAEGSPPDMVRLCAAIVFALASVMIVAALSPASGSLLPEPHPATPATRAAATDASTTGRSMATYAFLPGQGQDRKST